MTPLHLRAAARAGLLHATERTSQLGRVVTLVSMTETVDAPSATRIPHWIGGRRVEGGSGRSGPVYNPATGRQTGAVDFATAEEVDAAVQGGGADSRAVC
jgi:hypothetical protein